MEKLYIVTDPCYILPNETWSKAAREELNGKRGELERFHDRIEKELRKFTRTDDAVMCSTGYGDWSNAIFSNKPDRIKQSKFFADSGLVCVCEYNDNTVIGLINNDKEHLIDNGGAAIIKIDGKPVIEFDTTNPRWTMLYIKDDSNNFQSSPKLVSDYEEDEYEDDDDEWDEEY